MHMNQQMTKIADALYKTDANDPNYAKLTQLTQSQTRGMSTNMSMEMMDLQKFAQNIATTLEFATNAMRTFKDMRQTPIQAIAARGG